NSAPNALSAVCTPERLANTLRIVEIAAFCAAANVPTALPSSGFAYCVSSASTSRAVRPPRGGGSVSEPGVLLPRSGAMSGCTQFDVRAFVFRTDEGPERVVDRVCKTMNPRRLTMADNYRALSFVRDKILCDYLPPLVQVGSGLGRRIGIVDRAKYSKEHAA